MFTSNLEPLEGVSAPAVKKWFGFKVTIPVAHIVVARAGREYLYCPAYAFEAVVGYFV